MSNWDSKINKRIDEWHACPLSYDVSGLFQSVLLSTEAYITKSSLTHQSVINIVKDLRDYLNPHGDENLYHFTYLIADAILLKYIGMTPEELPVFTEFLYICEERVFFHI